MVVFKPEYLEHQVKHWMRPDAYRFIRPDWRRYVTPGSELWSIYERYERKYSPEQPRVPAGSREGGQWTGDGGGGSSGDLSSPAPGGESTAGSGPRVSQQLAADCELIKRLDTFTCQSVRTRSCWAQAAFRYSQCLIGGYIPPIYH